GPGHLRPPKRLPWGGDVAPGGGARVEIQANRPVQYQDESGKEEGEQVAPPKDRSDEPETEKDSQRWEHHNHETEPVGAEISEVTFSQPGPNGDIDGINSRQSETDREGGAGVTAEVARWDDDNPQRQQSRDVKRGLRPDEIR